MVEIYADWILNAVTYHYFNKVYVKEFCAISLTFAKSIVYFVQCPPLLYHCEIERATYKRQLQKHGMSWESGTIGQEEFKQDLKRQVNLNCSIYTYGKLNTKYFTDMGYDVTDVSAHIPCLKLLTKLNDTKCPLPMTVANVPAQ